MTRQLRTIRGQEVVENCPAKVNLFLEVLGRRPDGYHDIVTVMAPVSLADRLRVEPGRGQDVLDINPAGAAPSDGDNSVLRALEALRRVRRVPPLRIRLRKRIPSGSGLGGASTDAAGILRAVDRLFGLKLSAADQEGILARVGSDAPFFARGVTALCAGRGERVFPVARPPRLHLVLWCPPFANPTADVYRRVVARHRSASGATALLDALARGRVKEIGGAMRNRLEEAAFAYRPELRTALRHLERLPFVAVRMTGSGSAFFGLCRSAPEARRLASRVAIQFDGLARAVQTI